jgi:hypothetical protein
MSVVLAEVVIDNEASSLAAGCIRLQLESHISETFMKSTI